MEAEMNNKKENLQAAIDYVKTFYKEVSQMVVDTIELMGEKEWKPVETESFGDMSYTLDNPNKWMCSYVYKNFKNEKIEGYTLGILVFFDEDKNNKFPMSIVCSKVNVDHKEYNKWNIFYFWEDNINELKELTGDIKDAKGNENKNRGFTGRIFSLPLTDIKSKEDLIIKVVNKLLEL